MLRQMPSDGNTELQNRPKGDNKNKNHLPSTDLGMPSLLSGPRSL